MANDRERQPEMDYYELRRRREQVLSQRAKQRPEWDTAPARRAPARPAAKAPAGNVKQSVPGVDVFPPKQTPLVRNTIKVNLPNEEELKQKRAAAEAKPVETAEPEIPVVPAEPEVNVPEEAPAVEEVQIPAADIPAEEIADVPEITYGEEEIEEEEPLYTDTDVDDEDLVDEEIGGNNPFTPFVKLAGSLSGKFGEWKQSRADKPKKKGLFGKKQPEEPAWDENTEDWAEDETYADEVYEEIPVTEAEEPQVEEIAAEEPVETIEEAPAADIAEEAVADIADEMPVEEIAYDEPTAEAFADGYYDEEIVEEQPKKKFSLKGLFSFGKKKQPEEELPDEDFDGFEDFDAAEEPVEFAEEPTETEPAAAEDAPAEVEEIAAEEPAEAVEIPEEIAEPEAEAVQDVDLPGDEPEAGYEWNDEEYEEEPAPKKKGLFGFFRKGPKKTSDEELLELLGDDDDDDDWSEELDALDAFYSPEDDAERSYDDMNKENMVATKMAEGMGEPTLSRKERRELAERMAAEAAAAQAPVAPAEEETFDEVDEPTRAFKPVRAARETVIEDEDDYDSFDDEEEEEPAPKKKGLFGRKNKKVLDDDELDDLLFDDEDEDDEPVSKKKSKKSRYDDDDDYDDDDYDDYDDDDDYDDYDDDDYDDDEEGGSFIGSFFKALFTIVLVLAAAIIVLNLLAGRNIAPAQTAVNAIAGVLPESVSEVIFPEYEPETDGNLIIEATPEATDEATNP